MTVYVEREFPFTDTDFNCIRTLVKQHTGIVLSDAKCDLVYGRLTKRLRQLQLENFQAYCQVLQTGDSGELEQLVNAITTNLTMFFREAHHFDALATTLLPSLRHSKMPPRHLRIWSAGCATGEEPYSIAMVCQAVLPDMEAWDVKILATDIDSHVLATAQRGVYSAERLQGLSRAHLQRWFHKGQGVNTGFVRVVPALRELITFRQLNLIHPWPMRGPFDIIFCRNVAIYFDTATQHRLFDQFANLLTLHGYLLVGHSESLFQITNRFELLGKTIYRRCR
jgi:chemotaxis protein methyltransferase CheR